MSLIDKKTLEHLAELARIKLSEKEEAKLLADLKSILGHFEELKEVDTSHVTPLTGGTNLMNATREDELNRGDLSRQSGAEAEDTGRGRDAFPEREGRFLRIPPMNL
jgi:aspartyl-tRNA(Asn)/glutamyl-tRNA(Gln) amidotransferase subunit C